ncbi:MAG: hypothetical protein QM690_04920 [Sphingobium sp.]
MAVMASGARWSDISRFSPMTTISPSALVSLSSAAGAEETVPEFAIAAVESDRKDVLARAETRKIILFICK